jgi:glycosyltransferase involved in cell wall biosynthesis
MKTPAVSIIMNCLDGERYLRQAIDSVFNQTYKDWEIIFWDNGSTDASAEIAKSYGERVRYFCSKETYTLGKARNLCMAESEAKYIAFLDCDDLWLPQKLEKQISLMENDPEVALAFSDAIYFNENGDLCQIYLKFKPPRGKIFKELFRKYFLCMTSVVLRRSTLQGFLWFDEKINLFEDACFFLRLAYRYKLDYCDEPLVKYRVRPDSGTIRDFGDLPYERGLALKTLTDEFPNFEKEHEHDIKIFQSKTNAQRAINEWTSKNPEKARMILKNTSLKNPLIYALFFITFLPVSTFKTLFILNYKIKSWFNWYKFE